MSNNPRTDMICFHISSELFSIKWLRNYGPVLPLLDKVSGVNLIMLAIIRSLQCQKKTILHKHQQNLVIGYIGKKNIGLHQVQKSLKSVLGF